MRKREARQSSTLALRVITVVAAGLLLYVGHCGVSLVRGRNGLPHNPIYLTTGFFMVTVIAVWFVLRAILRRQSR